MSNVMLLFIKDQKTLQSQFSAAQEEKFLLVFVCVRLGISNSCELADGASSVRFHDPCHAPLPGPVATTKMTRAQKYGLHGAQSQTFPAFAAYTSARLAMSLGKEVASWWNWAKSLKSGGDRARTAMVSSSRQDRTSASTFCHLGWNSMLEV